MRAECMAYHAALRRIRSIHPAANPNRAFMAQLEALDHVPPPSHDGCQVGVAVEQPLTPGDVTRSLSWQRMPSVESVGWMTRSSYPSEKQCGWMQRIPSVPQVKSVFVTGEEGVEGKSTRLTVEETSYDVTDEDSKSVASTARLEGETSETEDTRCEGSNSSSPRACIDKMSSPVVTKPKLFWHTV